MDETSDKVSLKKILGFVLGLAFIIVMLVEIPPMRWFLLISVGIGLIAWGILSLWHKYKPITEPKDQGIKLNLK